MRLLTPQEIDKLRMEQEQATIRSAKKVIDMANQAIKKANTVKEQSDIRIKNLNEISSEAIKKHVDEVNSLSNEIERLRLERSELLKPLDEERTKIEQERAQLQEEKKVLSIEVQSNKDVRDLIKEREQYIGKAIEDIKNRNAELDKREHAIDALQNSVDSIIASAHKQCDVMVEKSKQELDLAIKNKMKYQKLFTEVLTKSKLLDEKEKELSKREQKYQSDVATLQVAFKLAKENSII